MEIVAKIQHQLQQCRISRGFTGPQLITWSWVCVKLLDLLSNYPSGVTEAIILAELYHELQSTGGKLAICKYKPQKKVTVSAVLDSQSVDPNSVLVVYSTASYCIPGTTTKVIQLGDCNGDGNRYIEMYLHRKFYDITNILTTHPLRMTCCRLVPSNSASRGKQRANLQLLPTELVTIVLDKSKCEEWQRKFMTLGCLEHGSIVQPDYIESVYAKVVEIETEELVHSPDGDTFKRVIVQLADVHVVNQWTVQLILWDNYVAFVRLFDKGDVLFLQRPYAKPTPGGSFYLEHGPATIIYMAPFEPIQEVVPSQCPRLQLQAPVTVKKTDDGRLDFTTYPEKLTVADIPSNMINGVLCALCREIGRKEFIADGDGKLERFTAIVQDHTGSISVVVLDPGLGMFEKIYCQQWLVLVGLSSCADEDGLQLSLVCNLKEGAAIYNVSSLPGLLTSPSLCSHMKLASCHGTTTFTTVAGVVEWYCTSEGLQPVEPVHCSCRKRVQEERNHGIFTCQGCSQPNLVELQTHVGQKQGNLSDESQCWRWQFSLGVVLKDDTGSIQAQITSLATKDLLQKSSSEFAALPPSDQQSLLDSYCSSGQHHVFSVSLVPATDTVFQINAVYLAP